MVDRSPSKRFWCNIGGKKVFDDMAYQDELLVNSGEEELEFWKEMPEDNKYIRSNLGRIKNKGKLTKTVNLE